MTAEQSHRYYVERRDACKVLQRCYKCWERDAYTMAGRLYCADCIEAINAARREQRRAESEAEGDARRQTARDRHNRLKAEHLCTRCRRPLPPDDPHVQCQRCRAKGAARAADRRTGYLMRGENGICYLCCKNPAAEGKNICEACYGRMTQQAEVARRGKHAKL